MKYVVVSDETYEALSRLANEVDVTTNNLIERVIAYYVEEMKDVQDRK